MAKAKTKAELELEVSSLRYAYSEMEKQLEDARRENALLTEQRDALQNNLHIVRKERDEATAAITELKPVSFWKRVFNRA